VVLRGGAFSYELGTPVSRKPAFRTQAVSYSAVEREGKTLKDFQDICLKNGSSQSQNLAWTVLFKDAGLDCLICAEFARERTCMSEVVSSSKVPSNASPITFLIASGFGFRVQSFAFRIQCFGLRVSVSPTNVPSNASPITWLKCQTQHLTVT